MKAIPESQDARRYLLGQSSEEESAALELDYFDNEDVVDRIAAVEDDLIEDYLSDGLNSADREHFERVYPLPRSIGCGSRIFY